jgi:creatinine amidohydrolase
MELGRKTWTDIDEPYVVVPVGSCEQHGPHLPLHTDTTIATALADALSSRRSDCVVAPPIAISASGEHAGFPGTLSIGTEAMAGVVIEVARSADWAAGVIFVNGHGGNVTAMERAGDVFGREERDVLIWWPRLPDADPHAGHTETSLMLALAPAEVRRERSAPGPVPTMSELVDSGVLGDPTTATAEHGAELLGQLTEQLVAAMAGWVRAR